MRDISIRSFFSSFELVLIHCDFVVVIVSFVLVLLALTIFGNASQIEVLVLFNLKKLFLSFAFLRAFRFCW
jgi:hypothetical protein